LRKFGYVKNTLVKLSYTVDFSLSLRPPVRTATESIGAKPSRDGIENRVEHRIETRIENRTENRTENRMCNIMENLIENKIENRTENMIENKN